MNWDKWDKKVEKIIDRGFKQQAKSIREIEFKDWKIRVFETKKEMNQFIKYKKIKAREKDWYSTNDMVILIYKERGDNYEIQK